MSFFCFLPVPPPPLTLVKREQDPKHNFFYQSLPLRFSLFALILFLVRNFFQPFPLRELFSGPQGPQRQVLLRFPFYVRLFLQDHVNRSLFSIYITCDLFPAFDPLARHSDFMLYLAIGVPSPHLLRLA